ncbi:mitochodrial transcription termination factor [Tanacetum coccineum]
MAVVGGYGGSGLVWVGGRGGASLWKLGSDYEKKFSENILVLRKYEVSSHKIESLLLKNPGCLLQRVEWLDGVVKKLEPLLGIRPDSPRYLDGVEIDEIVIMTRSLPSCLRRSEGTIKAKLEWFKEEIGYGDHRMEEPETESDSEEIPFKTEKINKVKSEYRKGESSKNKSRNYEFRMPMHKGIPNKNNSSSGAINILNLDCISDLTERKRILEKWSTEISLILQTNQDDFQTAKSVLTLIEHKTEGNIQSLVKQAQWNEDIHGIDFFDSVIDILYTMFVGIDYHGNKDLEIIKEQEQARRNKLSHYTAVVARSEEKFVKDFVLPYCEVVPCLYESYTNATGQKIKC